MRKKDTLYKADKWNKDKPLFMLEDENIFWPGGQMDSSNPFGISLTAPTVENPIYKQIDFSNPIQKAAVLGTTKGLVEGFGDYAQQANALNIGSTAASNAGKGILGGLGKGLLGKNGGMGAMASIAGDVVGNLIGGGYSSGVGNALGSLGKVASVIPGPWGAAASFGLQTVGGAVNALWGTKVDEQALKENKEGNSKLLGFSSNAGSFDAIKGPQGVANVKDAYAGGVFKKGWAEENNRELWNSREQAALLAQRGITNNVGNLEGDQINDALANYSAFGGALDYGLTMDYLNTKRMNTENNNQMANLFAGTPKGLFALGGDIQTNGADWSTGMMHINAGKSHEENPNDGVQLGVDSQNVPNLVEEGETVFDDYVFSNRIVADATTLQKFHLPKKTQLTYADISKKLEKEIKERENDPISQAGFRANMHSLMDEQERQKADMEAQRAKEAFEALSPEEQTAIMQRAAQEEAMAQEAVAQQEAVAAQNAAQVNPEEAAIAQQQMMQADGSQAMVGQEPQQFAEGGDTKKKKNVGSWKNDKENHWDIFTKPGLKRFIENLKAQLNMAPDEEAKDRIRHQAMNELNTLQQSYYDYVREGAANATQGYSDNILNHQKMFDKLYGNTGFYSKDNEGNVKNLIAEAINLPNGAATDDKPDNWFDGYNGPRTSIRNFGSTAYGDDKYYQDLVDEFKGLGLSYAPNDNWKDDNGVLYGLSIPEAESAKSEAPKVWDWNTGDWIDKPIEDAGKAKVVTTPSPSTPPAETEDLAPKHKWEGWRYAGLLGPSLGLGLMAAGVGKPDTASLDAAVSGAGNVALADYQPLGDYLTYRPMDIWYEQNRLNANARATDRAIMNSGANQGGKAAALLASGYNDQLASGDLYRKALEYNDALRERVAAFNRGTNQFNADAYNQTSRFNVSALNDANRASAQMKLNAAAQKLDADAGWYNSLYGNIGALTKGIADIGVENKRDNMINWMISKGIFGAVDPNDPEMKKRVKVVSAEGGKISKKNKRKGLTF